MAKKGSKPKHFKVCGKKTASVYAQSDQQFRLATVVVAVSVVVAGLYYLYAAPAPWVGGGFGYGASPKSTDSVSPPSTNGDGGGAEECDDLRYELRVIEGKAVTRGSAATDPLIIELLARDATKNCIETKEQSRLLTALMDRAVEAKNWARMSSNYKSLFGMATSPDEQQALWWDTSGHFFKAALDTESEGKSRLARQHYLSALEILALLDEAWPGNTTILGDIAVISGRLNDPTAVAHYERYFK